jgi:hypothetical protein
MAELANSACVVTRHLPDDRLTTSFTEYLRVMDYAGDVAEFAVRDGQLYVRASTDGGSDQVTQLAEHSWVTIDKSAFQELLQFLATHLSKP